MFSVWLVYFVAHDRSIAPDVLHDAEVELPRVIDYWKKEGDVVGVKFGHYRRLTESQTIELIFARRKCNRLVLVIEKGERTEKYKGKKIELSDEERMEVFSNTFLVDVVVMTDGLDYSNDYYRRVVQNLGPDVLFASTKWGEDVLSEYKYRAFLVEAKCVILPSIGNYSTTQQKRYIFTGEEWLKD